MHAWRPSGHPCRQSLPSLLHRNPSVAGWWGFSNCPMKTESQTKVLRRINRSTSHERTIVSLFLSLVCSAWHT